MTVTFSNENTSNKKKKRYAKMLGKINKNLRILANKEVDISDEKNKANFYKDHKGKVFYCHGRQVFLIGLYKEF